MSRVNKKLFDRKVYRVYIVRHPFRNIRQNVTRRKILQFAAHTIGTYCNLISSCILWHYLFFFTNNWSFHLHPPPPNFLLNTIMRLIQFGGTWPKKQQKHLRYTHFVLLSKLSKTTLLRFLVFRISSAFLCCMFGHMPLSVLRPVFLLQLRRTSDKEA